MQCVLILLLRRSLLENTGCVMKKILGNKRYSGFVWHMIFTLPFVGLSLLILQFTQGVTWFLISSVLRIVFGVGILIVSGRLFELVPTEIISNKNLRSALTAGLGFLLFFLYFIVQVVLGFGRLTGLTVGIFLTKVLLQQLTTGFYEELNYRFLLLEGLKFTANSTRYKLIYVFASTVLFGIVHCIPSWDTYTFLTTGAIGFSFAVIYVKSGNIVLPMVLHFIYDFLIKMTAFVQWRPNPFYNVICGCSDIAYVVMFMISFVILIGVNGDGSRIGDRKWMRMR